MSLDKNFTRNFTRNFPAIHFAVHYKFYSISNWNWKFKFYRAFWGMAQCRGEGQGQKWRLPYVSLWENSRSLPPMPVGGGDRTYGKGKHLYLCELQYLYYLYEQMNPAMNRHHRLWHNGCILAQNQHKQLLRITSQHLNMYNRRSRRTLCFCRISLRQISTIRFLYNI